MLKEAVDEGASEKPRGFGSGLTPLMGPIVTVTVVPLVSGLRVARRQSVIRV